jgi:hypothetical protein
LDVEGLGTSVALELVSDEIFVKEKDLIRGFEFEESELYLRFSL